PRFQDFSTAISSRFQDFSTAESSCQGRKFQIESWIYALFRQGFSLENMAFFTSAMRSGYHLFPFVERTSVNVFIIFSTLSGFATWASMPASFAAWTSSANAFAVIAMIGMDASFGSGSVRMACVASCLLLAKIYGRF
ncbi:MAG: hypothetical protein II588_04125, partial [Paludibacteraceae bacterium]|nr:hypothetical protein [Paludibacteraceae bacterium]